MQNNLPIKVNERLLPKHQRTGRSFSLEHKNLYELFSARAETYPQKIFAIFPEYDKQFTYENLHKTVVKHALYLKRKRLGKGDRIGLVLPTSPDFIALYFAAFRSGITVVPINPDLPAPEIEYIAKDAQLKAIFYNESQSKKIVDIKKNKEVRQVSLIDVSGMHMPSAKEVPEPAAVDYTDEALVIYTSGTTGNPKGAVLSHLNLLADSRVISQWFQFTPDTRTLCTLPLFHNNGQVITLLAPLSVGGSTVLVPPKTSLKLFWSLTDKYRINWTSVMPSILAIILSLKLERKDASMKGIICGGQVLNAAVKAQFERTFHVPIFEGYGLTETTSFASFNRYPKHKRKSGTVGQALPCNDIVVMGKDDEPVPHGEVGEICMRGLNVMMKYHGLNEVNKRVLRGGWFHSGDFGHMDASGNLYFKTRKDYLIKKGGENIYPGEVENVLFAHPAVDECAVIGVPDALLGQDIVAFVIVNRTCTETALKDYLVGRLSPYKFPKKIIIVNERPDLKEIPKGPTKKVLYRMLLEYYTRNIQTTS